MQRRNRPAAIASAKAALGLVDLQEKPTALSV
jgi:hypothetical protein